MLYYQQASFNHYAKHFILKLDVFPWHGYRELQDYSFVFSVFPEKENKGWNYVETDIVHDSKLLAMNKDVFEAEKFIFTEGNLVISEIIEIVKEETRFQTQYVAILKKQVTPIKGRHLGTRNLLLFVNNLEGDGLSDKYSAYYAKEFEASVAFQKAEMDYWRFMEVYHDFMPDTPEVEQFKKFLDEKELEMKEKRKVYAEAKKREYLEI